MYIRKMILMASAAALFAVPAMAKELFVGNLYDMTGPTSGVGKFAGQGKIDALEYINKMGGINGKIMKLEHLDYSYKVPQAIAAYKRWKQKGVAAIQGWGTGDTEALIGFVAKDKIPYISLSFSGHLTDPTGKGPKTKKAAPYNFFVGPSYSDGARALIQWAAADWKKKGSKGKPKYIHMGANHPYPNAPKAAGESYAKELGFDVLPAIQYSMRPGDFKAQCLSLKEGGADYAFLANTGGSNTSLLKSCKTVGVKVQFVSNIWGMDENTMKAVGAGADGVVWVMSTATWLDKVPGMKLVREVSKMSDPSGKVFRPVHYLRGVCPGFYMRDAMVWADNNGGITGPNIKKGFEQMRDHVPAGLEGVCGPATWTATDHRSQTKFPLYQVSINGDTSKGSIEELLANGTMSMAKVFTANIPRRADWLGW